MLINLHEAEIHLSELVEQAARGEEIVIVKAGMPRARLVPVPPKRLVRKPGVWKGLVHIADDFDTALSPDVLRGFSSE